MKIITRRRIAVRPELTQRVSSGVRQLRKNVGPILAGIDSLQKELQKVMSLLEEVDSRSRMLRTFGDAEQGSYIQESFQDLEKRILETLPRIFAQLYPYVMAHPKSACASLGEAIRDLTTSLKG